MSSPARSTRTATMAGLAALIAGVIFVLAGAAVWVLIGTQLSAQKITVGDDAGEAVPALSWTAGQTVSGPFTAYAQAEIIDMHATAIAGGNTYAELGALVSEAQDAGDTERAEELQAQRNTVMNASFLRASLFTSVVSYGVAAMAIVLGILLVLGGLGLRQVAAAVATTSQRVEKEADLD
ncbi:aromatic ring-opening dioxygenase LigA [Pseudactinotalea sp.]|uniref:aromatic ring-opening dioxygenase LigA n=1 Tax=Pseudactinotalea sp. TaxID=1926260 RepID=UPI003B3BB1A5